MAPREVPARAECSRGSAWCVVTAWLHARGPHTRCMVVLDGQPWSVSLRPWWNRWGSGLRASTTRRSRPPSTFEAGWPRTRHWWGPTRPPALTLAERIAHWELLVGSQPTNRGALLAIRSGAIVGLVEWELGVDGDPGLGEIHAIHVAPVEQGRGVGWRLLNACVAALRAQGLRRAILWVVEDNAQAR